MKKSAKSRELFETRFSTSTRINEQEEQILSLERTIRNLDSDKNRLEAQLEIASQKSRDSIALADHEQIIASIRLEFANKLKEQQKTELEHGETIKRKNQEIGRLQDQIEEQIRQKGEIEAYAERIGVSFCFCYRKIAYATHSRYTLYHIVYILFNLSQNSKYHRVIDRANF